MKLGIYLNNLADVFRKEKKYGKALETYEKSLKILSESLHVNHFEVAEVRENMALVYIDLCDFDRAEEQLNTSKFIILQQFGESHPKLGFCLHKFGMLASSKGDSTTAISTLNQSLSLLQSTLDSHHPGSYSLFLSPFLSLFLLFPFSLSCILSISASPLPPSPSLMILSLSLSNDSVPLLPPLLSISSSLSCPFPASPL